MKSAADQTPGAPSVVRTPLLQNPKTRALIFQILIGAGLAYTAYFLFSNVLTHMAERGKFVSLSFLDDVAPFGVGFSPFWDFKLGESNYWEVFVIAIQNTILVSVTGIISATLLGFLIGVSRLSPNWIISKLASVYIETFRNVPLLLQIFFWYVAVFLPVLPPPRQSWTLGDGLVMNKEGAFVPAPIIDSPAGLTVYAVIVTAAIIAAGLFIRWSRKRQEKTGRPVPLLWVLPAFALVLVAGYFISGTPLSLEYPELGRFNYSGGINLGTSFVVMWFALTTYTAAFIGENVRGGILAVSHGQTEAAYALGLHHGATLRLIVIPQALRVIIPPTISQYLNLTKNSSLAIAVAYEELSALWIGISLSQTGQEFLIIASAMMVYLTLSLLTSGFLNWYNQRIQLTEQ